MDVTNRVAAITLSLLVIFVAFLVLLLTWGAPDESIARMSDFAGFLEDHNDTAGQFVVTFLALIFMLLGLTVIIFEMAPPETGSVKVGQVGAGEARIGTDEIGERLEEELRTVPRLREVQASVSSRGARADIKLDLYVDAQADVATTANQAIERTREIVERRMGVELDRPPKAAVHFREFPGERRTAESAELPTQRPSWRPADAAVAPGPSAASPPSNPESVSNIGPAHEASPAAHEDQPSGA
jgi:hypothetical protein